MVISYIQVSITLSSIIQIKVVKPRPVKWVAFEALLRWAPLQFRFR